MSTIGKNFEHYIAAFEGTPKPFSEVAHLFDALYHDDFETNNLGKVQRKNDIKKYHELFCKLGSKGALLKFQEIGPDSVELKFQMKSEELDVVLHNIAMVKEDKIVSGKHVDSAASDSISRIRAAVDKHEAVKTADFVENGTGVAVLDSPQ